MSSLCRLCRLYPAIPTSHVLPALAYSRFVADKKGGGCLKLDTFENDSKQMRREWFCTVCEGKFGETYAGRFLDKIIADRANCSYQGELLRFAVACSWRSCLHELDRGNPAIRLRKLLASPCEEWRRYLNDENDNVNINTQHAFVIRDKPSIWDERIGMTVAYPHSLVITQLGPFVCFGNLGIEPVSRHEEWVFEQSVISDRGGTLHAISKAETNYLLTDGMVETLDHAEIYCGIRNREFHTARRKNATSKSRRRSGPP